MNYKFNLERYYVKKKKGFCGQTLWQIGYSMNLHTPIFFLYTSFVV